MKIKDTFIVCSVYNDDMSWLKDYTDNHVFLNAGEPQDGMVQVPHVGYNIHAYLSWIVDNYEKLPETVMFIKGTIFKKCIPKEEFDLVCDNKTYTPLLKKDHVVDGKINYYKDEMYYEVNNSWWFNHYKHKYFHSYKEFADKMGLPSPEYLPFAPGACYIVPKENILKRSKEFYIKLRDFCDYDPLPSEAHAVERAFHTIWL